MCFFVGQDDAHTCTQPSHSLDPGSSEITVPGKLQWFLTTFTVEETAKMTDALKCLGYTFTHLIDAATALATFELNPVSEDVADKAHVAYDVATYVGPHCFTLMLFRGLMIAI